MIAIFYWNIGNLLPVNSRELINGIIGDDFNISVINRIEVLGHPSSTQELSDFLALTNQYELTKEIVAQTIVLRKTIKIKLPDAIIAATAIVHNFILVTRNMKDFKNIEGLETMNPHNL